MTRPTEKLVRTLGAAAILFLSATAAADTTAPATDQEPVPEFTQDVLADPARIAAGREVWQDQCRHCHGKSAYPGKAPKLRPRRYKPDFVYDRVTNGFRKMPPWKEVYSQDERISVVTYILSKEFAP
jgi:cytochrome c5